MCELDTSVYFVAVLNDSRTQNLHEKLFIDIIGAIY